MVRYIVARGRELIAEHRPALIVSHDYGWFYNGLGAAKLSRVTGVPYLSEIHHVPGYPVAADLRERIDRGVARRYVRWARSRAKAFRVVNSVEMPELLRRWGVPDSQILVLPSLYIDLEVFSPRTPAPEPEYDVTYVGRMVNNKGLDRIVDAVANLGSRGIRARLLMVGKGPLLAATKARVAQRGLSPTTHFVEWVESPSDLAEIYRRSRVVVCASTCEGGPRFTVEAMACGTPVVSSPVGMMKELVRDGVNGAPCGFDLASLTGALERVLADEAARKRMGAAAREATLAFEYSKVLRGYADGLKRLVGEAVS